jgi:hypothetical protein
MDAWVKDTFIGLFIITMSCILGFVFRNPYPCSMSGCGCSSVSEMFADSWSDYIACIGSVFGLGWIFVKVFCK